MQTIDVKYALEKYHQIRKAYQAAMDKIEAVNAVRFKPGTSMPKIPESEPEDRGMTAIKNMNRHDSAVEDMLSKRYYIRIQDEFMVSVPEKYKDMIEDKYINRITGCEMEKKYGYDRTQMFRIINKLIELYVQKHDQSNVHTKPQS